MPILQAWTPFLKLCCCFSLLRGGPETFLGCGNGCGLFHTWSSLPAGNRSCCGSMFMSGVCVAPDEMSESRQTHVTLHDIDPQALEQLVQYAYTAEIVVGEGNVQVGASPQISLPHRTLLYKAYLLGVFSPSAQRFQLLFGGGTRIWQRSGSSSAPLHPEVRLLRLLWPGMAPRSTVRWPGLVLSICPSPAISWPCGELRVSFSALL